MNNSWTITSATGMFFVSTLPNLSQEIRAPFGLLYVGMSIYEAEAALKAKSYSTRGGSAFLESNYNGKKYHITFGCSSIISPCDGADMAAEYISVIYTNEISFDIRPREVESILKDFGFGKMKTQKYNAMCAAWMTKTTMMGVGQTCRGWGIRMKSTKSFRGFPGGGERPCEESCF